MNTSSDITKALSVLSKTYYKVIKANLTSDTYEVVKVMDSERAEEQALEKKNLSYWLTTFADKGNVYEADVNIFRSRLSSDSLRRYFKDKDRFRLRYRRKTDNVFRWVFMEILRDENFSEDNQNVWFFVQDIHDSYIHEMEVQRELEHFCKYDTLTGLNNFYSYQTLCRSFASEEEKKSVAVIFADLNGLKLINDTRGHTAGNDFLRSFTHKVSSHFCKDDIYRISGDEFLIVMQNADRDTVLSAYEKFNDFLNREEVPQASLGFAWQQEPSHIEDVTRDAETHMYESKEAFYEKHPEYKRGIAELNYKREIDAILQNLSNTYAIMATVDLIKDSFRILKSIAKEGQYPIADTYSELILEMLPLVDPDYHDLVSTFFSIDHLKTQFQKNRTLVCEYKSIRGHWRQVTFRIIEMLDGNPSKALFIMENVDHSRANQLEKNRDLLIEHQIIEGLSMGYSMICQIELSTRKILLYKNLSLLETITTAVNSLEYDTVVRWFVKKYVVPEDKERVLAFLNFSNVKDKLEEKDVATVLFRTIPEFHNTKTPSYSQFYFFRLKSDRDKVVLATKNVTNSMG